MALQITRVPPQMRRFNPFRGFTLYLWTRYRRSAALLSAPWLIAALICHFCLIGQNASLAPELVIIVLFGSVAAFSPLVMMPKIDESLWKLPVSIHTLIAWMMLIGVSATALLWIATAALIWRPIGWSAPIFWPAAMLAAIYTLTFTMNCQSAVLTTRVATAYVLGVFALVGLGIAGDWYGLPQGVLVGGYLTAIAFSFPIAVSKAGQARRGDGAAPMIATLGRKSQIPLPKFHTHGQAQVWFERRLLSRLPVAMSSVLGTLSLLGWPMTNFIADKPLSAAIWNLDHVSIMACLVTGGPFLMFWWIPALVSVGAPGSRNADGTLTSFLTTRPISAAEYIEVKLRVAAYITAKSWATFLPFAGVWLLTPATVNGRSTLLGNALWTAAFTQQGSHALILAISIVSALIFLTWKLQTDLLFLTMIGRRWAQVSIGTVTYLFFAGGMIGAKWLFTHPSEAIAHSLTEAFIWRAAIVGVCLKMLLLALVIHVLRRRDLISAFRVRKSMMLWAVAALFFILLFCTALAPYHIVWPHVALAVLLFMPGLRLALAPLAFSWDRSR
ncbi:MAG: hypothetical protein JWQ02_3788 [Capsulimonas sp.]|jgi:hypothetical protein|nr:hypothetical protein [Capsulimonas sp.]